MRTNHAAGEGPLKETKMNNTVLAGLILGTVVVVGAGAVAVNSGSNPFQKYATVVGVEPAFDTNQVPRQVCGDEATIASATAAATAGSLPPAAPPAALPEAAPAPTPAKDEKSAQSAKPGETAVDTCVTVYDTESIAAGFDVTYELDGVQSVVRMDRDPGKRLPVEDGEIVVSQL
jgi:uncharacterized protein YcfJ